MHFIEKLIFMASTGVFVGVPIGLAVKLLFDVAYTFQEVAVAGFILGALGSLAFTGNEDE